MKERTQIGKLNTGKNPEKIIEKQNKEQRMENAGKKKENRKLNMKNREKQKK